MGLAGGHRPHPRAIIFDLDRCLIDSRKAWRYCIEESIAAACNRKVSAQDLVEEYHIRPWRDALGIVAESAEEAERCLHLCETMFERSAMKALLVHEGIGMALDALRGELIEIGAISRRPHASALKQVQSTGLDRFVAVLSATPGDERWDPEARIAHCLRFLEAANTDSAFVSGDWRDLERAREMGLATFEAAWAPGSSGQAQNSGVAIATPPDAHAVVMRAWAARGRTEN